MLKIGMLFLAVGGHVFFTATPVHDLCDHLDDLSALANASREYLGSYCVYA